VHPPTAITRADKPVLAYVYRPVMARACYAADANTDECTFLGTGDQLLVSFPDSCPSHIHTCGVLLAYGLHPSYCAMRYGRQPCQALAEGHICVLLQVPGFGVEMALKNMEYSALDDSKARILCTCIEVRTDTLLERITVLDAVG